MLAVTENAAQMIREIAASADLPREGAGIRFSLDSATDAEAQLEVALVEAALEGDEDVEKDGSHVYLDAEAALILGDKVLDAELLDGGQVAFSLADRT